MRILQIITGQGDFIQGLTQALSIFREPSQHRQHRRSDASATAQLVRATSDKSLHVA